MVSVEETTVSFTCGLGGLNEQYGGIVTSGVMVEQESVTPALVGLLYPSRGLIFTIPSAPLPAGTLLGATAVCTVTVNCGVTDSTVRLRVCGVGEYDVPASVAAIVIV